MRFYHEINYNEKNYTAGEELLVNYIDVDKLIKKTSKIIIKILLNCFLRDIK